jgi:histidinol dehydrogenase
MIERLAVGAGDAPGIAKHVRGYIPAPTAVHEVVAGIIASVEEGGDPALLMHERRFGDGTAPLRVSGDELQEALAALDPAVRQGLELARANVGRVAEAPVSARIATSSCRRAMSCGCASCPSAAPPSTRRAGASRTRPRS